MHLYLSGTPKNDRFQAIENQMCSHRLFSLYRDYQAEVFAWLRDVKSGIRDFAGYCDQDCCRIDHCASADRRVERMLIERGIKDKWPGYHASLIEMSERHQPTYPKHIMLDSGAFTAWNAGATVTLDEVRTAYSRFLQEAGGLFEEIWLINLDVIPGKKGRPATAAEKQSADEQSDKNFSALQKEFGNVVLPVYHQDSGKERLLEVIDQANGYMCLSPFNNKPEEERWRWATLARSALSDLNCNIRTHGLATTGNDMLRHATLFSGDSEAWTRHARYGVVDLAEDQATYVDCPTTRLSKNERGELVELDRYLKVDQREQVRYKGYHISAELNDWDRSSGDKIIDNARHFEHLKAEQRVSVRNRVELHVPFLLAQFDMRARSLVNLAELRAIAKRRRWSKPTGPGVIATVDGTPVDSAPFAGERISVGPRPSTIDRQRFLSRGGVYNSL